MSRPNPANPVGPLLQVKAEMQNLSDKEIMELESELRSRIKNESGLNEQRVKAFFTLLSKEKNRRDL